MLVKAASPEYTLSLEKILIIFAVGLVSVDDLHRLELTGEICAMQVSFTLALGNLWCVLHGSLQVPSSTVLAQNSYHADKI